MALLGPQYAALPPRKGIYQNVTSRSTPPAVTSRHQTAWRRVDSAVADAFVATVRAHINKANISKKQSSKTQVSNGRGARAKNMLSPI